MRQKEYQILTLPPARRCVPAYVCPCVGVVGFPSFHRAIVAMPSTHLNPSVCRLGLHCPSQAALTAARSKTYGG